MQFNPSTEYNSIVKNIRDLTDASVSNLTLAQIARSANNYLNRAYNVMLENSDNKNWDDPNFDTLPQGTYDIVENERQITVYKDEDGKDILKIRRVILKLENEDNKWQELYPMDLRSDNYVLDDETTGIPQKYDWIGDTLMFDIIPNYSKTDGIKVFYERAGEYFTESDTVKEPGLPEHFHDYIVYGVSYDYSMKRGLQRANEIKERLDKLEKELREFATNQSVETNKHLRPLQVNVK